MPAAASSLASSAQLPSTPALSRQPPAAGLTRSLPLCNLHSLLPPQDLHFVFRISMCGSTSLPASPCLLPSLCRPTLPASAGLPVLQHQAADRDLREGQRVRGAQARAGAARAGGAAAGRQRRDDPGRGAALLAVPLCNAASSRTLVPVGLRQHCTACFTVLLRCRSLLHTALHARLCMVLPWH